jgi:hypothetical protein
VPSSGSKNSLTGTRLETKLFSDKLHHRRAIKLTRNARIAVPKFTALIPSAAGYSTTRLAAEFGRSKNIWKMTLLLKKIGLESRGLKNSGKVKNARLLSQVGNNSVTQLMLRKRR